MNKGDSNLKNFINNDSLEKQTFSVEALNSGMEQVISKVKLSDFRNTSETIRLFASMFEKNN